MQTVTNSIPPTPTLVSGDWKKAWRLARKSVSSGGGEKSQVKLSSSSKKQAKSRLEVEFAGLPLPVASVLAEFAESRPTTTRSDLRYRVALASRDCLLDFYTPTLAGLAATAAVEASDGNETAT